MTQATASSALPRVRKHYVETTRGDIAIQEAGSGPHTLVLVTLTSFASALVPPALAELALRGYRAIALDIMGYGRSDKRNTVWMVDDFADNIIEALDGLGVTPEGLVCGHFAALMGIEIAARGRPGLRGLVLDGTPIFDLERRQTLQALGSPPPMHWTEDGAHALENWRLSYSLLKQLTPGKPLAEVPSERYRQAYMALLEAKNYEPLTQDAAANFDVQARMGAIDIPTLAICSDTDWNLKHHQKVLEAIKGSTQLRLAGTHPLHDPDALRPDEYADHLHRFFGPLFASSSAASRHATA